MNPIPLWIYAVAALAIGNLGAGLWGWHELDRAKLAEQKVLTVQSRLDDAITANEAVRNTMAELRATNDANRKKAAGMTAAAGVLTDKVNAIARDLAAKEIEATNLRRKLYASDAKLRDWGARAVPDTYSGILRVRWGAASGQTGSGGSVDGSIRGAPAGSDGAGVRADSAGPVAHVDGG